MNNNSGFPRGAAIALGAVAVTALCLGLGMLLFWRGDRGSDATASTAAAGQPALPAAGQPAPPTAGKASPPVSVLDVSREPSMHGLEPTLISVDFDNLPVPDAANAFSTQASVSLSSPQMSSVMTAGMPPLSMHLQNAPLLEGLLEFYHSTRAMPNEFTPTDIRLTFAPRTNIARGNDLRSVGRWCVSGPFAMVINHIETSVDLSAETARGPAQAPTMISCVFFAEPGLKVLQFPGPLEFEEPADASVQVLSQPAPTPPGRGRTSTVNLSVPLAPSGSRSRHVPLVRIRTSFVLAVKSETLRTSDPADDISQTVGGMDVHILPLKSSGAIAGRGGGAAAGTAQVIEIQYQRGKMDPAQWARMRPILASLEPVALGPGEETVAVLPTNALRPSPAAAASDTVITLFNLRATAQVSPHHVRLEVPVELRDVSVPFEFKDLVFP